MRIGESIARGIFFLCASSSILILLTLLYFLWVSGGSAISNWIIHGFGWIWAPEEQQYGIIPLIYSTLYVALGATIFASVIGILSGIYLAEYADQRLRNAVKPGLEMLSGVPSIVLGLFGSIIITALIYDVTGTSYSYIVVWITLGILIMPTITSLTEDSIRAVPSGYKEASYALGASRWQTTYRVVVPSARSGIINAFLLTFGRGMGEVMVVYFTAGNVLPQISLDPFRMTSTIPIYISTYVGEGSSVPGQYQALNGMGLLLMAIVGIINVVIYFTSRRAGIQ